MNMAEILEHLGSETTEEMFHTEFAGKSISEIRATLDEMFPHDNNEQFAKDIYLLAV